MRILNKINICMFIYKIYFFNVYKFTFSIKKKKWRDYFLDDKPLLINRKHTF